MGTVSVNDTAGGVDLLGEGVSLNGTSGGVDLGEGVNAPFSGGVTPEVEIVAQDGSFLITQSDAYIIAQP